MRFLHAWPHCCIIWKLEAKMLSFSKISVRISLSREDISQSPIFFIPVSITVCLSLWCSHYDLSLLSLSSRSSPTHSPLPLSCTVLFSFRSLMFLKYSQDHTYFLSLCLSRWPWHTCALSTTSCQRRFHPPLSFCPLLAHLPRFFEVIRALCHSSQLLSSHRAKYRNVFSPCWSLVISPPVLNESVVTHSFIGNSL